MARPQRTRRQDRRRRFRLFLAGLGFWVLLAAALVVVVRPFVLGAGCAVAALAACLLLSRAWMIARDSRLPILVYHSVSAKPEWLIDTHVSLPVDTFERQMRYLAERGYQSVSLDAVREHVAGRKPLPPKSVALTFDDGYADNWVAVYPILKKYHFTGTIFVSTDFIDPRPVVRKNLEDVWRGRAREGELEWDGYVSWPELRLMEESGVLRVEGHLKSHTWLFDGDEATDFYQPGDRRFWMQWNADPDNKPFWYRHRAEMDQKLMGRPIYSNRRSHLVRRRYKGDLALDRRLNEFVKANGGEAFFRRADWRALLRREMASHALAGEDRWETEEEARARIEAEFEEPKRAFETRLGKTVRFVCWPGDQREPWLEEIARQAGFEAMMVGNGYNRVGEDPARLARLYFPMFHRDLKKETWNLRSFIVNLRLFEGNYYYAIPFGLLLLYLRWASRNVRRGAGP